MKSEIEPKRRMNEIYGRFMKAEFDSCSMRNCSVSPDEQCFVVSLKRQPTWRVVLSKFWEGFDLYAKLPARFEDVEILYVSPYNWW